MNIHTRLHNIGYAFAAAALLLDAGCAGGSSLPSTASAQQFTQTQVHPVTHHLNLAMLFKNKASFGIYPDQVNAGECWQPSIDEKPMGPGAEQAFTLDYDFRCGDNPPAFTVLWRKSPAALGLGCEFSFAIKKAGAGNRDSYNITATNDELKCAAKRRDNRGGVLMHYGLIAN